MISDTLSDAVDQIQTYLAREAQQPRAHQMYRGAVRARIVRLVRQMDRMRRELGTPPATGSDQQDGQTDLTD